MAIHFVKMKNRQTYNDVTSRKRFVSLTCYWNFHKLQNNQQTFLKIFCVLYPIICIHSILLVVFFLFKLFCNPRQIPLLTNQGNAKFFDDSNFTFQWYVITQHFKQTLLNIIDLALIYICSDVLHWVRWSMYMRYANQILYMLT